MISSLETLVESVQLASASRSCSWVYHWIAEHRVIFDGMSFDFSFFLRLPVFLNLAAAAGALRHGRLNLCKPLCFSF